MKLQDLEVRVDVADLAVGVVYASRLPPLDGPLATDDDVAAALAAAQAPAVDARRTAVRDLLRHGVYKPTGRGKPASEYLLGAAAGAKFPKIHPLVDAANLVSLASLLPISLVDLDRAATHSLTVRRGRAGESYVFNSAAQTIELADLLVTCLADADEPCANPVKDSMRTKLGAAPTAVCAIVYAPASLVDACRAACFALEERLRAVSPTSDVSHGVAA